MLRRNGTYDGMIERIIESKNFNCEPSNLVISYLMNVKENVHSSFITNDRLAELYILDITPDGSTSVYVHVFVFLPFCNFKQLLFLVLVKYQLLTTTNLIKRYHL